MSGGHIVCGTWVIKRCQANRAKWVWEGVSPFFFALFLAILRRALTTASGTREALRREATRALTPSKLGVCTIGRSTVVRKGAHATGATRAATASKMVV